ncbi:MAG: hypothetical protein GTO63_16660 [Anaerolineae bacterium]|nr:hypothetical protein [Anaerolineae bacterium]NIQ79481.1 hypothetical protein [Anaerolineae bacterium]
MSQRKITFYINDKPITRWYGTTVEQGVLAYDQGEYLALKRDEAWVVDGRGSRVGRGGTLDNGARLYIRHVRDEFREP